MGRRRAEGPTAAGARPALRRRARGRVPRAGVSPRFAPLDCSLKGGARFLERIARARRHAKSDRSDDRGDAGHREHEQPGRQRVGACPDAVDDRDGPGRVGEPVHHPPRRMADEAAREAGHHDGEQQLEGDRAEAKPEGPVVRGKGHHGCQPPEVREWIDDRGDDVKAEKDERHQGQVSVKAGREETRPSGALDAKRGQDAEHDDRGQQDKGDGAGAARRVPEERVVHVPPETTTPEPDEDELMGVDDEPSPDVEDVDEAELEVAVLAVCELVVAPGMVDALTAPSTPTPASAPTPTPVVKRLSRRNAASRARTLSWVFLFMDASFAAASETSLRES